MNSSFIYYKTFGYKHACLNIGNLPQKQAQSLIIIKQIRTSSYINNQMLIVKVLINSSHINRKIFSFKLGFFFYVEWHWD